MLKTVILTDKVKEKNKTMKCQMKKQNIERESRETDCYCSCLTGLAEAVVRKTMKRVIFRSSICGQDWIGEKTHKKVFH